PSPLRNRNLKSLASPNNGGAVPQIPGAGNNGVVNKGSRINKGVARIGNNGAAANNGAGNKVVGANKAVRVQTNKVVTNKVVASKVVRVQSNKTLRSQANKAL
ncbi:hypothetical protein HK102_002241, partial [Quaeritorhiza haematococci]